jgi:hypothetical protein
VRNRNIHAKDRWCSFPKCDVPKHLTEVHLVTDYAKYRTTGINDLTRGWGRHTNSSPAAAGAPRKLETGNTEWIPPRTWTTGSPEPTRSTIGEKLRWADDEDDQDDEGP